MRILMTASGSSPRGALPLLIEYGDAPRTSQLPSEFLCEQVDEMWGDASISEEAKCKNVRLWILCEVARSGCTNKHGQPTITSLNCRNKAAMLVWYFL